MIHYHDDNFLFEVSSLEATFSDDVTIHDGNVTVKEKTPLGKEVWIVSTARAGSSREQTIHDDDDAVVDHIIVRLIFITPEQDWRRNQTYAYSAIQVQDDNDIWVCQEVEMNFRTIRETLHAYPIVRNERLLLKNVQLGLGPSSGDGNPVSPCLESGNACAVVDGEVKVDGRWGTWKTQKQTFLKSTKIQRISVVVIFLVGLIMLVAACWRRYQRSRLYQQLSPTPEEDLRLKVEDTYHSNGPRSTVNGHINDTR